MVTCWIGVDIDNPGTALDRSGHPNPVPRKVGRRTIIAAEATAPGIVSETAAAPQAGGACARTRCAE